jgi:SAM-dependent methyltransferase
MNRSVRGFYDALAPWYDVIYQDWEGSIARQAQALDGLIAGEWGPGCRRILDAAIGVGTQALGLASRGYSLIGSDLSSLAVQRAAAEARRRSLGIPCLVADMRALPLPDLSVDAVIACDNALPHLLSEAEIGVALSEFLRCLRAGGGCIVSMRDYGAHPGSGTVETQDYGSRVWGGRPCRLQQIWQWRGELYDVCFEVLALDAEGELLAMTPKTTYFAIPPDRVATLMRTAGFRNVRRVDGRFFQPLLLGTR